MSWWQSPVQHCCSQDAPLCSDSSEVLKPTAYHQFKRKEGTGKWTETHFLALFTAGENKPYNSSVFHSESLQLIERTRKDGVLALWPGALSLQVPGPDFQHPTLTCNAGHNWAYLLPEHIPSLQLAEPKRRVFHIHLETLSQDSDVERHTIVLWRVHEYVLVHTHTHSTLKRSQKLNMYRFSCVTDQSCPGESRYPGPMS